MAVREKLNIALTDKTVRTDHGNGKQNFVGNGYLRRPTTSTFQFRKNKRRASMFPPFRCSAPSAWGRAYDYDSISDG